MNTAEAFFMLVAYYIATMVIVYTGIIIKKYKQRHCEHNYIYIRRCNICGQIEKGEAK